MPVYLYEVVKTGEILEIEHGVNDEAPQVHPESGLKIQRIYAAPHIAGKFGGDYHKKILSDESIAKSGFTKYVRDPVTRRYNRTAGKDGPEQLRPHG